MDRAFAVRDRLLTAIVQSGESRISNTAAGDAGSFSKTIQELQNVAVGATPQLALLEAEWKEDERMGLLHLLWPSWYAPGGNLISEKQGWRTASLTIGFIEPDGDLQRVQSGLTQRGLWLEDMVYFSFVSLTTTGYGDIKPVSTGARVLTILENLLEVLFTSVFLAGGVALLGRRHQTTRASQRG